MELEYHAQSCALAWLSTFSAGYTPAHSTELSTTLNLLSNILQIASYDNGFNAEHIGDWLERNGFLVGEIYAIDTVLWNPGCLQATCHILQYLNV